MTGRLRCTGAGVRAAAGPARRGRRLMAMLAFVVKLVVMLLAVLTRAFVVILAARTMLVVFTHSHCSLKSSSSVNFSGADRPPMRSIGTFYRRAVKMQILFTTVIKYVTS